MVAGQPVMVSQAPLMVSMPQQQLTQQQFTQQQLTQQQLSQQQLTQQQLTQQQLTQQQLTPVTMVTAHLPAGTINSTATNTSNQATNLTGSILTRGSEKVTQSDKGVGLFELAQVKFVLFLLHLSIYRP